jgi:hypothetical protein
MVFGSGLLYRVRASESYLDICLFKEVGDFSDLVVVVCEGGPIFVFVVSFVCVGFVLHVSFQSRYEMDGEFVFCYGEDFLPLVSFLSVVRGSDVILLVR